jgi:hypothetical protein
MATTVLLSVGLLATSGYTAATAAREYQIQRALLVQTAQLAARDQASSVVVRDQTGELGDVYSFLPPMIEVALRTRGVQLSVTICTPAGIERRHEDADRLQIATTPACEALPPTGSLVLDAAWGDEGQLLLTRSVSQVIGTPAA